jgi:hypothetical protein
LEVHNDCTPRTIKVLKNAMLGRTDKHQRKVIKRRSYLDFAKLSFIWVPCLHESKRKTKMTQLLPLLLSHTTGRATSNQQRDE